MEVTAYCDNLAVELTGWKGKVQEIVTRLDHMATGDKIKVVPHVNELHALVEELDDRIDRLKRECPTEWEPDRIELESRVAHMKSIWEDVWQDVSPADAGG